MQLWMWIVATVILGFEEYITVMLGVSVGVTAGVLLLPIFMIMLTPETKARVGGGRGFGRCGERRLEGGARRLMAPLKGDAATCAGAAAGAGVARWA